ncbi:MAG: ATP-dependent 6-phosphofructokinase [Actinomycetota bacterium]|jgi:6-phosphofructokinase 1|nr:ATP-dependent 6-phosphofructokinase [Actinomycetota bacterium]
MKIGVLTGGGDCPGLNAVIRAVVLTAHQLHGDEVVGFEDGWRGVIEGRARPLSPADVRGIQATGGTILGTSRTNPLADEHDVDRVLSTLSRLGMDGVVVIGGDDTLGVARGLAAHGVGTVGVPKTIDNDLSGTEVTFGFDTAVQIATEAIDRLQTTAESHHRVIVCEVMGRHAGWIATYAGIAGGAAEILVPEIPFDLGEVCGHLVERHERGQYSSVVVAAEGALPAPGPEAEAALQVASIRGTDAFGHVQLGGIGAWLATQIEERTGYESRVTALGHIQRGGTPTAYDRVLASRFGVAAVDAMHAGKTGMMVALQAGEIVQVPLEEAVGHSKTVDRSLLTHVARPLFA